VGSTKHDAPTGAIAGSAEEIVDKFLGVHTAADLGHGAPPAGLVWPLVLPA
jgi:hypothetical protein